MEAIKCGHHLCHEFGTPSTMYWAVIDADVDDEGRPVGVYGPACATHAIEMDAEHAWWQRRAADPGETLAEAGMEGEYAYTPETSDLLEWAEAHGLNSLRFVEQCVERSRYEPEGDLVPYGDTMVMTPPRVEWGEIDDATKVEVADEWWSDELLEWVLDAPNDTDPGERSMSLARVGATTNNDTKGK